MGAVGTGAFGFVLATAACLMTARAAEWSMAPTLDVSVDHDSNRTLLTEAIPSEGLSMSADALLQRATEDFSLSLHPQVLLQRFTDRTITDRAVLESELDRIVNAGYAVDNEEYALGVACVAVPVRNRHDDVIASIAVQGATARLPLMRAIEFVPRLRAAAAEIGATFG